jgi:hypothetical protein
LNLSAGPSVGAGTATELVANIFIGFGYGKGNA